MYGSPYQPSLWSQVKAFLTRNEILPKLILINAALWVLISLLRVILMLLGLDQVSLVAMILNYLCAPANPTKIIGYFWTIITYNFIHLDFIHLLFNMLWLYWMGLIFIEYLSQRRLLWVYLMGGISGYLVYMVSLNFFPGLRPLADSARLIGASASVMAVVSVIAFYLPNYTIHLLFLGRIKLLWMAIGLFVLDFLMINSNNPGGHLAHMGGFIFGYIYVLFLKNQLLPEFDPLAWFRPRPKVVYRSSTHKTDEEYNASRIKEQMEIDRILDKIKSSGYQSLTPQEKETLFKASRKNN